MTEQDHEYQPHLLILLAGMVLGAAIALTAAWALAVLMLSLGVQAP